MSIVAFGCSTISRKTGYDQAVSFQQHALLLTLKDALQKPGVEIVCLAQDPIYSATDIAVLGRAGITVVADPKGFLHVDEHSVVFTCAPNVPVREIVLDLTRPAVVLWTECLSDEEYNKAEAALGGGFMT